MVGVKSRLLAGAVYVPLFCPVIKPWTLKLLELATVMGWANGAVMVAFDAANIWLARLGVAESATLLTKYASGEATVPAVRTEQVVGANTPGRVNTCPPVKAAARVTTALGVVCSSKLWVTRVVLSSTTSSNKLKLYGSAALVACSGSFTAKVTLPSN